MISTQNTKLTVFGFLSVLLTLACAGNRNALKARVEERAAETAKAPVSAMAASLGALPRTDLDQHISELKKKLPSNDFSIVIQPPFVVVGDEPLPIVQQRADDTIKWAVEKLKQDFFTKDPEEILDIWLFKDATSYEKHTRLIFKDEPSTPYGYYSSSHKALIMNIATGGGTLVHEIVHPFIEANFPECPPWLNEGLGSLYEQPGLQQAIKAGNVPSFKTLMSMDSKAFYNDDRGINYAQSRYLCYYLQERGLLVRFYKQFHAQQKNDPGGYKSLKKVLAEPDMDRFKRKWEKYVMNLTEEFVLRPAN